MLVYQRVSAIVFPQSTHPMFIPKLKTSFPFGSSGWVLECCYILYTFMTIYRIHNISLYDMYIYILYIYRPLSPSVSIDLVIFLSLYLFICLSIYLSVCLSILSYPIVSYLISSDLIVSYLSIYLSVCLSIYLSISLSLSFICLSV